MYKYFVGPILLLLLCLTLQAQQSFRFLNRPTSARALALGGSAVTAMPDAGMWLQNPALLDSTLSGYMQLSYQSFYAGVRQSNLAYTQHLAGGVWGVGVQYINYGEMQGYDPSGEPTALFSASDYVVQLSHAREWQQYTAGASLKWASSGIAAYRANALLLDVGGTFRHPSKEFIAGFAVSNIGVVTSSYTDEQPELPLEVRLGATFKPQFMPFRFTFTAHHLQEPKLGHTDLASPFNKEEPPVVDQVMRHLSAGAEFLLSKNINLRAGYNHLLRQELKLENTGALSGFSLGFMVRVRSFSLDYSRAWYHVAGGTNQLSLGINLNRIFKNTI
jgi:hypothetical protein